ncbi:MAG: hypothetical protein K8S98_17020 [Planctomycetes bacterium]|nr:hypothetical protein [Planctomycetota bacterium]
MKSLQIRSKNHGRRGIALLYSLLASFAVATMVTGMFAVTFSSKGISDVKIKGTQARYLAEGAIEIAKNSVQATIANWGVPQGGTATINGTAIPYTVTGTGLNTIRTDAAGIQTIVTGYAIEATAAENGHSYTAHRLINAEATPVFQFAVFYTNDLEINPGPNMTLAGRIHTNQDMYLNCGGTLTCNTNYVHAVGSVFRNRKDDSSLSEGTVQIRKYVTNPFSGSEPTAYAQMNSIAQMAALGITTTSGYDANFNQNIDTNGDGDYLDVGEWQKWALGALGIWAPPTGYTGGSGSTVMDSAHGVTEAEVPYIGSIKMFEPTSGGDYVWNSTLGNYQAVTPGTGTHSKGYYHSQAGLSILTNAAGTQWKAYDASGTDITTSLASKGVVSLTTMYDARQDPAKVGTKLQVTQIDIAALNASGYYPSNGLVYAAQYGAGTGLNCKGVKLKNGSTLNGKLTVVSEDSIYIQGDFNTSAKKGAAVIADAINLLSKSWNDSKTSGSALPTASATTYNVAMISGNQNTAGTAYNGGLENLPRFHENWSGVTCTIKGSFVNTWLSQYATGNWVYGGKRYTAPNRAWAYDTAFNTVSNLPPYTPMAVSAVDAAVW